MTWLNRRRSCSVPIHIHIHSLGPSSSSSPFHRLIHSIHIITHTHTQTHVSIIRAIAPPETAAPNASANYRRNKVVMTPIPQLHHNRNRTHNHNPLPVFVLHPWKPMTPNLKLWKRSQWHLPPRRNQRWRHPSRL